MAEYEKLTKFIPVLSGGDLGAWIYENGELRVEYDEVVYRFCDVLEAFCEKHKPNDTLKKLLRAVSEEERRPGLLLGYLANGTIAMWLRELED